MGRRALLDNTVTIDLCYLSCCLGYRQAEACADGMTEEMMSEIDKETDTSLQYDVAADRSPMGGGWVVLIFTHHDGDCAGISHRYSCTCAQYQFGLPIY